MFLMHLQTVCICNSWMWKFININLVKQLLEMLNSWVPGGLSQLSLWILISDQVLISGSLGQALDWALPWAPWWTWNLLFKKMFNSLYYQFFFGLLFPLILISMDIKISHYSISFCEFLLILVWRSTLIYK